MAKEMKGVKMENKIENAPKVNATLRILHRERKTCNGIIYEIYITEFGNGTRRIFIERQATKRLPRGFVASPPAPLLSYVKSLKKLYNIP